MKKALKITGIVLGSIVGLVLIVAIVALIMIKWPSGIASQVKPVISNPQAAKELDTKWQEFRQGIKTAKAGTEITVTLTQDEINSKINEELKTVKLPDGVGVSNLNVNLVDGKLLLAADVNYSGIGSKAGMEASVETVNGEPVLRVNNVEIGKLPIPQSLKDQLSKLIPENGIIKLSDLQLGNQNITIVDGKIVITGVTQ